MKLSITLTAGLMLLTAACSTVTHVTSNPSGADVQLNGQHLGKTPLTAKVNDIRGMRSIYSFTASKAFYGTQRKDYQEVWGADHTATIPSEINFDLK